MEYQNQYIYTAKMVNHNVEEVNDSNQWMTKQDDENVRIDRETICLHRDAKWVRLFYLSKITNDQTYRIVN